MTNVYDQHYIKTRNSSINVLINGIKTTITNNTLYPIIALKDNNNHPVLIYTMNTFYKSFIADELPQYHKDIIKYYNVSEEEIFQYNTIMDYNTCQAMVHLYDHICTGKKCTTPVLIDRVQKCIEHSINTPQWHYTIVLL